VSPRDIEKAISWLIVAYIIYLENKREPEASATITTLADFLEKELEIAIGRRRDKIAEARNHKIHWAELEEWLPFSLRKEYLSKMLITCAILWLLILNYEKVSNLLTFAEKHKENFLDKHFDFCKQIVEAFRCGDWRMFKKGM
jgi:hypothetical protein